MNTNIKLRYSQLSYRIKQLITPASVAASFSLLLIASPPASAVNFFWNTTQGNWSDINSWNPSSLQNNNDSAYINNGGTATLDSGYSTASLYQFALGQNAGDSGTLVINEGAAFNTNFEFDVGRAGNGTLTLNEGSINGGVFRIGFLAGSEGTVTVNSGLIDTGVKHNFTVGASGTGTLQVNNDGKIKSTYSFIGGEVGSTGVESSGGQGTATFNGNSSLDSSDNIVLGIDDKSRGTVVMNDNSTMKSGTILVVGYYGQGDMTLNDNAAYTGAGNILVGYSNGSQGLLTINDTASVTTPGTFYLGYQTGSTGELHINGGNLNVGGAYLYIGDNGNGHLTLNSGKVIAQGATYIGAYATSVGELNIHGGSMATNELVIGYQGSGSLNITDGVLTSSGVTYLGWANGSQGSINLNGGVFATSAIVSNTGAANMAFNGGTLRATEDNDDFIILPGTIAVGSQGAIIDSNGYTVGITPTFSGDTSASLTKTGAGSVNLLTANNTFFGDIIVNQGNLNLLQADTLATARSIYIQTGGSLNTQDENQTLQQLGGAINGNVTSANGILTLENPLNGDSVYGGNITSNEAVHKTGAGAITLSGQLQWAGDTYLDEGHLILDGSAGAGQLNSNIIGQSGTQLSLRNGAILTGWIDPTNVDIDAPSRWNMTASSQVENLANAGTIAFSAPTTDDFKTLTVSGDYQGNNGLLVLNTRLGDDNSLTDKLVIQGNTAGTTNVQVNNAGGSGAETLNGIEVITVAGQSNGNFIKTGRIVAGAYDYNLIRGETASNQGNWYLSNYIDPVDPKRIERPEASGYAANLSAANNMFVTRLNDRQGEKQYIDPLTGKQKTTTLWLRNEGGHTRSRDSYDQLGTQANRYVLQLGGELGHWSHNATDGLHLGVMAGYANSQSRTESRVSGYRARASVNGYSAGLYGTWYADEANKSGWYVDSWAQYGWFNNSVDGQDLTTEKYKSHGVTASIESGYTTKLGENAAKSISYFIQPQAQLTWMGIKADDHRENNGTRVVGEGDGNIQTRLGVKAFMDVASAQGKNNGMKFQPFVALNWLHNSKDFGTRMDGVSVTQQGAANIAELKVGADGQLNKQISLWGNVGQQVGNKGYSDTAVMLGVKYHF